MEKIMTERKSSNDGSKIATNEERGLTPASSGTPMPKVKPAATPTSIE